MMVLSLVYCLSMGGMSVFPPIVMVKISARSAVIPECLNPLCPLVVLSSVLVMMTSGVAAFLRMSWATLSPLFTVKGVLLLFTIATLISPL